MEKIKIGDLEVSRVCLGGGKFVDMSVDEGVELVRFAMDLGINIVDGHHRYGNAEEIYSYFPDVVRMTKVSAYKDNWRELVENSKKVMGRIDIMWVSDLDDVTLYDRGKKIYDELKDEFPLLGITTENGLLAYRFKREFPGCFLFMLPVFCGMSPISISFIRDGKKTGYYTFSIKSFLDKQLFMKYSVKQCIDFVKQVNPDVSLFGTSNIEHLKEIVKEFE